MEHLNIPKVYKTQSINVTIPAGSSRNSFPFAIEKGVIEKVFVYTDGTEKADNNLINMAIRKSQGGYDVESVSVENYKHPENGYTGAKPVNFSSGSKKILEFSCLKPVTADTNFQVVFEINQDEV